MEINDYSDLDVLCIDDDEFAIELVTMAFESIGVGQCRGCTDASKALEIIVRDGINLILLDLNMPGMDGIEFLSRLKQLDYAGYVCIYSGANRSVRSSAELIASGYKLNLLGQLRKPVTAEKLKALVDQVVG